MKKDIKYIMKRIIIGVGIAFGVMLVKSLPVFAEEKEYNYSICQGQFSASNVINSDYCYISGYSRNYYKYLKFNVPNTSIFLNLYFSEEKDSNYLVFYDEINESYIFYRTTSKAKFDFKMVWYENAYFDGHGPYNTRYFDKYNSSTGSTTFSETYYSNIAIFTSKSNTAFEEQFQKNITMSSGYKYMNKYNYEIDGQDYYFYTINETSPAYQDYIEGYNDYYNFTWKNYKLINKSMEHFYIDDTEKDVEELDKTPTGYEKIDMFNKYAILFYPKDFRNLPIECTKSKDGVTTDDDGNVTVIPNKTCLEESYKFTFYYSGYFNTAFTDLSVMDVVKNPVEQLTFPPTATPYELPLLRNINDFKGGIMFYNNSLSQITDDDGNVTTYYDKGYIYYDSSLFNYVIIEDYDTTPNQDISWIDKDGNTQNANINNIPKKNQTTLNEAQDTFDLFKNFKTNDHGLSSIITAPLSFIKNLSSATCTPVVLPIPFSKNQNVKLPCLTTMYEEKASSVYNIYKIVITGITAYWVCVRIYALVKGFKDPNDDKIEVMEL